MAVFNLPQSLTSTPTSTRLVPEEEESSSSCHSSQQQHFHNNVKTYRWGKYIYWMDHQYKWAAVAVGTSFFKNSTVNNNNESVEWCMCLSVWKVSTSNPKSSRVEYLSTLMHVDNNLSRILSAMQSVGRAVAILFCACRGIVSHTSSVSFPAAFCLLSSVVCVFKVTFTFCLQLQFGVIICMSPFLLARKGVTETDCQVFWLLLKKEKKSI